MAANPTCSFCTKGAKEVKKLIQGRSAYICDECTLLCLEIVAESNPTNHDFRRVGREVRRVLLNTELRDVELDLVRLNADRDNILYDLAALQEVSSSTVH